jgi:hypothetical protein
VADVVQKAFEDGCRFDNWTETFRPEAWDSAFVAAGVDQGTFLRPVPVDAALPWDVIDMMVSPGFLRLEHDRALQGVVTRPCEKPIHGGLDVAGFESGVVCHGCGAGCRPSELAVARGRIAAAGTSLVPPARETPPEGTGAWHIVFTRAGASAWLSQIDLVKHIPRIFKRAGYEPVFSGGFHPMPKFSYCEPMPVGYQSVGEWMDARLLGAGEPDLDRLNAFSIDGMRFLSICPAEGRRSGFRPVRYAFSCPFDAETAAGLLGRFSGGPVAEWETLPGIRCLNPYPIRPGELVFSVLWPARAERPAERAHDWIASLIGRNCAPSDLVRLYDSPVAGL